MHINIFTTFVVKATIWMLPFSCLMMSCRSQSQSIDTADLAHATDSIATVTISDQGIDLTGNLTATIDEWIFTHSTDSAEHPNETKIYRRTTLTQNDHATIIKSDSTYAQEKLTYSNEKSSHEKLETNPRHKPTTRCLIILAIIILLLLLTIKLKSND